MVTKLCTAVLSQACSPRRAYTVLTTPNGSRHEQHSEGRCAQPTAPEGSGLAAGSDSADAAASAAAEEHNGGEAANSSERSPDETVLVGALLPDISLQQISSLHVVLHTLTTRA